MASEPHLNHAEPPRILIVDDDPGQRSLLNSFLRARAFEPWWRIPANARWKFFAPERFDMMISDVRMPGLPGWKPCGAPARSTPRCPFCSSPPMPTFAKPSARCATARSIIWPSRSTWMNCCHLSSRPRAFPSPSPLALQRGQATAGGRVVARSPLMQALFRDASLIAPSETRVLITGESGVGKEVLADVIHAWSARAGGPMVKVNCAAIPETLLETELFGHEKGAFTGAHAQRIGRFEEGERAARFFWTKLPRCRPQLQAKLLRVTQDGSFQRVGSNREMRSQRPHPGRDQPESGGRGQGRPISRGSFLPLERGGVEHPVRLRERREDILPLASLFIAEFAKGRARFSEVRSRVSGALSVAGERARIAKRDGARGAALAERTDPAGAPAGARARRGGVARAPEARRTERLEEIERKAILAALCASTNSTARKPPRRLASAAAR